MNSIRFMNITLVIITIILAIYTSYSFYRDAKAEKLAQDIEWHLLNEPDPLIVERIAGDSRMSVCTDRRYEFRRLVKSTKALNIYVQERWHSIEGDLNVNDTEGEIVLSTPIHYPLDAGFEKVMTFKKVVPETLAKGKWEYRPIATYYVNEKKTITRPLPTQLVTVDCDYDANKNGK